MASEYQENMAFEAEVRRIAEAVWQLEPGGCQPAHYSENLKVREVDGIAKLRDITHLFMVTVSRKLDKVKSDVRKLEVAAGIEEKRAPVSLWLITKYQLDAEHVHFARTHNVKALTLENFRSRFFDGRAYLTKRRVAAFGSARNPENEKISIPENEYVELPMELTVYHRGATTAANETSITTSVKNIADRVSKGEIIVMTAPFGAGKSLSAREVFLQLMRNYLTSSAEPPVPIAINLREHWGQDFGDEILERHARSIGFSPKENLTIAWRAGIAALLIDGFDEVASQVVARSDKMDFMREARKQALQGARDLISKAPTDVGVLVCGRDHYFDEIKEMIFSLGITGKAFNLVRLGEFTEEQAENFLRKNGLAYALPDWLPRKPLILGYLAHRGLLESILSIDSSEGFGYAWNEFLRRICEREATLERAAMDPETVQRVLERLASGVRATLSGTGPITELELANAYRLETGQVPGEGVLMQLQRLPGLTEREELGTRSFIDEDMLAALQGSAIARYILGDFHGFGDRGWLEALSAKGIAMASYLLRASGVEHSTAIAAAQRATNSLQSSSELQMAADCISIALEMARDMGRLDCAGIGLASVSIGILDLEDMIIDNLHLTDCLIEEIVLGPQGLKSSLQIQKCSINRVSGIGSKHGLPEFISNCDIENYDDMSTNTAVLKGNLPSPIKALLTVLRKLYVQAGGGRKISALKRGIPNGDVLNAVDEVVSILESEELIIIDVSRTNNNQVAHPIRRQANRVHQILSAPNLSNDPVVVRVKQIH